MNTFQTISFILELLFPFFLIIPLIFFPSIFTNKYVDNKPKAISYVYPIQKRRKISFGDIIGKLFTFALGILFFIYFSLPYLMDLPNFVTGNLNYTTGKVYNTYTQSKDPFVYVNTEGKTLKFFFESGIKVGHSYKIGYLPHTLRGISVFELNDTQLEIAKKIDFPLIEILVFSAIILVLLGLLILMILSAEYLGFIPLIVISTVYYPISIYSYIKSGLVTGLWLSFHNTGFLALFIGLVSLLMLLIAYIVDRINSTYYENILFFAQVISLAKIFIIIGVIKNLFDKF